MRLRALSLAAALPLAAGCGVSDDRREAREVTEGFYSGVERRDGTAACERLAPPTADALARQEKESCEQAVVDLPLQGAPIARVQVFETNAAVRFDDGQVTFLDRRAGGWKVSAAGCRPRGEAPADCELED